MFDLEQVNELLELLFLIPKGRVFQKSGWGIPIYSITWSASQKCIFLSHAYCYWIRLRRCRFSWQVSQVILMLTKYENYWSNLDTSPFSFNIPCFGIHTQPGPQLLISPSPIHSTISLWYCISVSIYNLTSPIHSTSINYLCTTYNALFISFLIETGHVKDMMGSMWKRV